MADQEFPTGDDDRRRSGAYFVLPSETAEQLKRSEADAKKSPDRSVGRDARPPGKN
ncbi:hypothetical protein ACWDKQ_29405 [Saccharopolyspora sp. NPDC000995]